MSKAKAFINYPFVGTYHPRHYLNIRLQELYELLTRTIDKEGKLPATHIASPHKPETDWRRTYRPNLPHFLPIHLQPKANGYGILSTRTGTTYGDHCSRAEACMMAGWTEHG